MSGVRLSDEDLARLSQGLSEATPQEILRWAVETFHPKLMMATAFGAEGCCLLHMLADIHPRPRIINLETGYQFEETLQLRERIRVRYGIEVEYIRPELDVPAYEAKHGGPLYVINPRQCCRDRKVLPLRQAVVGYDAWISAIRSDQTEERGLAEVLQRDPKFGVVKVNPLLNWTRNDVWKFIVDNDIPYNDLHDRGYPSIGCWPCTRPVGVDDDERAGRFAGQGRKECGLHVAESHSDGSGI